MMVLFYFSASSISDNSKKAIFSGENLSSGITDKYTIDIPFSNPLDFSYNLSEISLDSQGVRLKNEEINQGQLELQQVIFVDEKANLVEFVEESYIPDGASIKYQLSSDYENYYYYNGNEWIKTLECENCGNTALEVSENILKFPILSNGLKFRVFLSSSCKSPILYSLGFVVRGKNNILSDQQIQWISVLSANACVSDVKESCLCDGGIKVVSVKYNGPDGVNVQISTKNYGNVANYENVQDGQILDIDGSFLQHNKLGPNTYLVIAGSEEVTKKVTIHTACSVPIQGEVHGNFTVISYIDTKNNFCDSGLNNHPDHGSVELDKAKGEIVYTPEQDLSGEDEFVYQICESFMDCSCDCSETTNKLTVEKNETQQIEEGNGTNTGETLENQIIENESDDNANERTEITPTLEPADENGTGAVLGVSSDKTCNGPKCNDEEECECGCTQKQACSTAKVVVTVNQCSVNLPPIANKDEAKVCPSEEITLKVLENDHDPDGELNIDTFKLNSEGIVGQILNVDSRTGEIIYQSSENTGVDRMSYTICDNEGGCASSEIEVEVEACFVPDPPKLVSDEANVCKDKSGEIDVLANDKDENYEIDEATLKVITQPSKGVVVITDEYLFRYTPDTNVTGSDIFVYEVCNEQRACASTTVTINIDQCFTINPQIVFDSSDTALCEYDSKNIDVTGHVVLPEGINAKLQLSWRIVYPDDLSTDTTYLTYGVVGNNDEFSFALPWPGIRPDDTIVETHLGGMLLDVQTGNPIMDMGASLDYYWYPYVCPPPDPIPDPNFSTFVECVEENDNETFTAYFGYLNRNEVPQELVRSDLHPANGTVIGTPPLILDPGRVGKAFSSVAPLGTNVVWTAKAGNTTKTATASASFKKCPIDCYGSEVVSYTPGNKRDGSPLLQERTDPENALGMPQNNDSLNFVSLGFGGQLILKFDMAIQNISGVDLKVTNTSFGITNCEDSPEKINVYASKDGVSWVDLGVGCQDSQFDLGSLDSAVYIKLIDESNLGDF